MNTKKTSILLLSAMVAGVIVSWTNANMFDFAWDNDKTEMRSNLDRDEWFFWRMSDNHFKKWINWNMKWLTDDEKTSLETMTNDEKKEFFDTNRIERKAYMDTRKLERQSHEAVIDKLINGETLTAEEEVIREEIKIKRADRKAKMEELLNK